MVAEFSWVQASRSPSHNPMNQPDPIYNRVIGWWSLNEGFDVSGECSEDAYD